MKYTNLENKLYEIGRTLEIGKEEIKTTLKNNKKPIIMGAVIIIGLITTGNMAYLGQRYATISPNDFWSFISSKFPFSFLS